MFLSTHVRFGKISSIHCISFCAYFCYLETTEYPMRLSIPSVELYVVLILSNSREQSTPGFFCQGTTYHGFFLLHFSLGTTNTDLKLCYIWTKVDIFSLGFYFSSFIEILATYKTTNHKFYNFHSIIRKCKRNMKY